MAVGTAVKTDDGYSITGALDNLSGLYSNLTLTTAGGKKALDVAPIIGGVNIGGSNPMPMYDGYQAPTSTTWTSATALNTAFTVNVAGYDTVVCTIAGSGTATAGAVTFEVYDGVNWLPIKCSRIESYFTDQGYSLIGSPASTRAWQIPVAGFPQFRVRLSTAIVGAGSSNVTLITSSAPDTSVVTMGFDPSTYPIPVQLNDGTNSANILKGDGTYVAQAAQFVAGCGLSVNFSTTTAQAVALTDISAYKWIAVQINQVGTNANAQFQVSNDGANWTALLLQPPNISAMNYASNGTGGTGLYCGPTTGAKWFRLNVTGITAGSTGGVIQFSSNPSSYLAAPTPTTQQTALSLAARTATNTAGTYFNSAYSKLRLYLNITAASGTGGLQVTLLGKEPVSGAFYPLHGAAPTTSIKATGVYVFDFGAGVGSAGGNQTAIPIGIPYAFQVTVTHGDASSYTYSVGIEYLY